MGPERWSVLLLVHRAWSISRSISEWLRNSRLQLRADANQRDLRYPRSVLIFCTCAAVFFFLCGAIELIGFVLMSGKFAIALLASTSILFGLTLVCLRMIVAYFRVRHRIVENGLVFQPIIGATGLLLWSEVAEIRYSRFGWFRITTVEGTALDLSVMLIGLPEFA